MSNLDPKSAPGSGSPGGSSESTAKRLPFEPKKNKKKAAPPAAAAKAPAPDKPAAPAKPAQKRTVPPAGEKKRKAEPATLAQTRIPDQVSRRMVSRIMLFSGVPTLLGVSTFFASYLIVTQGIFELPNVAVIFISMGFFGLGVLGLSYGVLSASWEEAEPGSALGWQEFRTNSGRFFSSWREFRQNSRNSSPDE